MKELSICIPTYNRAKEILTMHSDKLHTVANLLLEKEKVDGEEFAAIFAD